MTTDALIDGLLEREGAYVDHVSDRGGPTNYGVTAAAWGEYRRFGRPATRAEIQGITREQAVEFYRLRYVTNSPFMAVAYEPLRCQLIDFAVLSGTERATRWLQRVLDVDPTGRMDDRTKLALNRDRGALVNRALVGARVQMFQAIVAADPSQQVFFRGWCARALSFWDPMTTQRNER